MISAFYERIGRRKIFLLPLLLVMGLAYGYSVTHQTIGIDDLRRAYYFEGPQAASLGARWGMILWLRIMGTIRYAPFADRYLSFLFLFAAGFLFAALFFREMTVNGAPGADAPAPAPGEVLPYTVLACALTVYPLINEVWEYTVSDMFVCGNMMLCAFSLLYLSCHTAGRRAFIVPALLLTLVASSYESGIFFYIASACCLLFLRHCVVREEKDKAAAPYAWVTDGLRLAIPLAAGVVLRFVIGFLILRVHRLSYHGTGDTTLHWGELPLRMIFKLLLTNYVAKGLIYYPIGIFVVCAFLFVLYCVWRSLRFRRVLPVLLGSVTLISLFSLTLLQGIVQPYRTGQTFAVFCATVLFLAAYEVFRLPKKLFPLTVAVLVCEALLCVHMASYLNWVLALDHQRSENEEALVYNIGYKLVNEYAGKPVVFAGWGHTGTFIEGQVRTDPNNKNGLLYRKIYRRLWWEEPANLRSVETNVNSVLTWSKGTDDMLSRYFALHGFDIPIVPWSDQATYAAAEALASSHGLKPYEIMEVEDYVIVCLGWMP